MVFCPLFYYRAALRSWQDPEVFEMMPGTVQQHQQAMLSKIPAVIKKHYAEMAGSMRGIEDLVVDGPYMLPVVVLALVLWDEQADGLDVMWFGSSN